MQAGAASHHVLNLPFLDQISAELRLGYDWDMVGQIRLRFARLMYSIYRSYEVEKYFFIIVVTVHSQCESKDTVGG